MGRNQPIMGISRDAVRQALEAEVYLEQTSDRTSTPQPVDSYVEDLGRLSPFLLASRVADTTTPRRSFLDNQLNTLNRNLCLMHDIVERRDRGASTISNTSLLNRLENLINEWRSSNRQTRPSTINGGTIEQVESNAELAEAYSTEARRRLAEFQRRFAQEITEAETEVSHRRHYEGNYGHGISTGNRTPADNLVGRLNGARSASYRLQRLAGRMRTTAEELKNGIHTFFDGDDDPPPTGGGSFSGGSGVTNGRGFSLMSRLPNVGTPRYILARGFARIGGGAVNLGRNFVNYFFAAEALALAYARTVAWPWLSAQAVNWGSRSLSAIRSVGPAIRAVGNNPVFRLATLGPRINIAIIGFVAALGCSLVSFLVGINGALIEDTLNRDPNDPFDHGGVA